MTSHEAFSDFKPLSLTSEFESLKSLKVTESVIKNTALCFYQLLNKICNEEDHEQDHSVSDCSASEYFLIILSIICHQLKPRTSINFQTILELYIYQGEAQR